MAVTVVVATTLGVAACGDDGTETASGGDLERYCELQRELESEFDAAKLDELAVVAPPEIAEEIGVMVQVGKELIETGDHEALEAVAEEEAAMFAFNQDRCGIPNPLLAEDGGDDDEQHGGEE